MTTFIDTSDDFHPYECNGPGHCIHCDRARTGDHTPETCALCEDLLWFQADEEESVTAIQEAASKLKEIAAALGALDFSEEIDQIRGAVASIQGELQDLANQLQGAEPGEEPPAPSGVENVDLAEAEAAAGAEGPRDETEPAEEETAE
jgi:hypothetical protein